MKKRFLLQPHQKHFAHGGLWGMLMLAAVLLFFYALSEGYLKYWFGNDYKIVDAHEVLQSESETYKLMSVMRQANVDRTILVGTPQEALYFDGTTGFTGYKENNEEILLVQKRNPRRFIAFCTFDPSDPNHMTMVQNCVDQGASGFKLYSGHTFFYNEEVPLNDPTLDEFYSFLENKQLPLIFHVNTAKYEDEFEAVLKNHPDLTVLCPHFCLSSKNLQRLSYLFDTYPNLYTDVSFGDQEFLTEGLERIDEDVQKYREFITKYADRFFYATATVVTDYEGKNETWLKNTFTLYRGLLEEDTIHNLNSEDSDRSFKGLALDASALKQIYEKNWYRFMGEEEVGGLQAFFLKFAQMKNDLLSADQQNPWEK